jgi:SAM-dependent methyltransferase
VMRRAHDEGLTDVERWIVARFSPARATTAELTYDRMESQSDRKLPVIYVPLDPTSYAHWHDEVVCAAFARALRGAKRVLDVGPGDGWPSLRIAGRFLEVVGIDPAPRRVSVQRANAARLRLANVDFEEMDVLSLRFPDADFDGIVAASSIEQTGDAALALAEVFRVLRPGGTLAMIFEDYGRHGPEGGADEELWAERDGRGHILFYQRRTTSPPREAKYALLLDAARLAGDTDLTRTVSSLERDLFSVGGGDVDGDSADPGSRGMLFLERLAPFVTRAHYCELHHLTSSSLDRLLAKAGFERIRHLDTSLPEVRALYNASKREGRLERAGPAVWEVCRLLGAAAADGARPGPGDFVIARKPK